MPALASITFLHSVSLLPQMGSLFFDWFFLCFHSYSETVNNSFGSVMIANTLEWCQNLNLLFSVKNPAQWSPELHGENNYITPIQTQIASIFLWQLHCPIYCIDSITRNLSSPFNKEIWCRLKLTCGMWDPPLRVNVPLDRFVIFGNSFWHRYKVIQNTDVIITAWESESLSKYSTIQPELALSELYRFLCFISVSGFRAHHSVGSRGKVNLGFVFRSLVDKASLLWLNTLSVHQECSTIRINVRTHRLYSALLRTHILWQWGDPKVTYYRGYRKVMRWKKLSGWEVVLVLSLALVAHK